MKAELRLIDSIADFKKIRDEWNYLYDECQSTTIFLSWDWMFTWWEVFNKSISSKLFILSVYENNKLIGVAPFHILHSFPKSLIHGRTISFIGCGEENTDKIVSQYADFIVKPEKQEIMISAVSEYLNKNKRKWDFADFQFLLEDSVISQCFTDGVTRVHTQLSQYGNRFYIPEMNDFDDFLEQMENRWSKMYKKKNRKLNKDGDVRIENSLDIDTAKVAFKQLADMHEARWKNRTDINIFKSELFNEFHIKLLERLVPQNKASINTLFLDNEPLASYYYFTDKAQLHYYQSGFYSKHANRYSPLFLLVCNEIGLAIKDKKRFDFMFDENPDSYKKEQYAAQSKPMYRLMWSPYKSRMLKHKCAKVIQANYLKIKNPLNKYKKNN